MPTRHQRRKLAGVLAFLVVASAGIAPVYGHTVGISRGDYRVVGDDVSMELVFASAELAGAVPGLDANHDGMVSPSEVAPGRAAIDELFVRGLSVRASSGSCAGKLEDFHLTEEDGASIRASYHCPSYPAPDVPAGKPAVTFGLKFLSALTLGHRHLATATDESTTVRALAFEGNNEFEITVDERAGRRSGNSVAWPLFRLGIEHILTGYDHLLFLFGLILVGGRIRSLLVVITAFTVAHSITLGLSTLDIWAPSTTFVEPAIALSIAYIGVENWFVKDASRRWLITFPFGLIHGFGFAGALREISLPHQEVPLALLSFNAGVEAGQLAVLAVVLPAIFWFRRRRWFADPGVKAISAGIAVAGLWWFMIRVT